MSHEDAWRDSYDAWKTTEPENRYEDRDDSDSDDAERDALDNPPPPPDDEGPEDECPF